MGALEVECPKCHSMPRDRCRTMVTGRVTDTHRARIDAFWAEVDNRRSHMAPPTEAGFGMASTDDMVTADLRATAARRCRDDTLADYWTEIAVRISAALDRADYEDGHAPRM